MIADLDAARDIAEMLHRHYPGHVWAVNVSSKNGIATIMNLRLSSRWGFVMHLGEFVGDPTFRLAIRGAGELLERWQLSRGRLRPNEFEGRPVNLRGELIGDASG